MEDIENFQKATTSTKGNFLQFISDRDRLLDIVDLFYGSSLKDEEEICKVTQELFTTQYSLKSTQCALQQSKMDIEKLHEKFQRSYLPSYTPFNHPHNNDCILDHMEEYHEMVDHDMHLVLQVLVDGAYKLDGKQALDIFHRKL